MTGIAAVVRVETERWREEQDVRRRLHDAESVRTAPAAEDAGDER